MLDSFSNALKEFLSSLPWLEWVANLQSAPYVIFLIIFGLSAIFIVVVVRSIWLILELWSLSNRIHKKGKKGVLLSDSIFKSNPYKHLWEEYRDTLHQLKRKDGGFEYRATVPAEAFFTQATLVDNRFLVWNDFFRHLPGILTGLGIIGTFAGLISGLEGFAPSEEASAARESLSTLLHGVNEAFHLSAFAIICAIAVTFSEKALLAVAYKKVERINQEIDSLYDTGAGEEYLARLVAADEANAAQTAQLKDALVNDLRGLLTELTERQITEQKNANLQLGQLIGNSMNRVSSSLDELATNIHGNNAENRQNLAGTLDQLVAGFMERMTTMFGEQMRSIQSSMDQSALTMSQVEQAMAGLVDNIQKTTGSVMEDVMKAMENTMQRTLVSQEVMTKNMGEFVTQVQKQMQEQQQGSNDLMHVGLTNITQLQEVQHQQLTDHTKDLIARVGEAAIGMQLNVNELKRVTTDAVSGMNSGADRMKNAADAFTQAGQSITGILEKANPLATQLSSTSNLLTQASQSLASNFSQYQSLRSEIDKQVKSLQELVQSVQREAGLKQELIDDVQKVIETLKNTERESIVYLENVNEVLIKSFEAFGSSMKNEVARSITQTDAKLSSGVQLLTGVVQELGSELQRMRRA
ncbi:MAG: methyl-accepting chemotaxis protein [Thiothrix sp.]|nr:MAG: methyl-accepting chemotaxis protein [Thiothrix sp.]